MKQSNEIELSEGKLLPKLLAFSLPVLLSGILQLAFNAADLIVVGRYSGEAALAGVGSNAALVSLMVNLLLGLGTGASVLAARCFGAKDEKAMSETVQTTVIVGTVGGLLFALLGIFASGPLLRLMSTPAEVLPLARLYLRLYFLGLPFLTLYNFCSAILRSVGDTRRPLLFMALSGVLNVILNLFFVIVLQMSVAGVAIATVMSQAFSCTLTLRCLRRSQGIYRLLGGWPHVSAAAFRELLRVGLPAGVQGSLFSISNVIIQSSVNSFGAVVVAGNAAVCSLEGFILCGQDSVTQAAVAAVSQCMGARKYARTKRVVWCCALLELGVSALLCGSMLFFRYPLLRVYIDDAAAIEAGMLRLLVMGSTFVLNGVMSMLTGAIRGHGYSMLPTGITLVGICGLRILWIYTVFAASPSPLLLYLSYPLSWVLTITALFIAYFSIRQKAFLRNEARLAVTETI